MSDEDFAPASSSTGGQSAIRDGRLSRRAVMWRSMTAWLGGAALTKSSATPPLPLPSSGGSVAGARDAAVLFKELIRGSMPQPPLQDDIGRFLAGEIKLPPGRYRISDIVDLAPASGLAGLTISGSGVGTEILFDGPSATLCSSSSRGITFRDLTFRSVQGVDALQRAFTIEQKGNPIRSWRFERCDFINFLCCFLVKGSAMASEFYFDTCQFIQCFNLLENHNEQAVNWNFVNCNWENTELSTQRDTGAAAAFLMAKGSFVRWTGGSFVFVGRLVVYRLKEAGSVQRPSHMLVFDGVRMEIEGADDRWVPFVDRVEDGYVSGTNQPTTAFYNSTILQRGREDAVPYANAWANCSLSFVNCKAKGGWVTGILDHVTPTQNASIWIENCRGISYREDTKRRLNSHDQHHVTITPDGSASSAQPIVEQRPCSVDVPATIHPKYMYVRGATGSLPEAGTTVTLSALPDHTMLIRLFVQRFEAAAHPLVVELREGHGQGVLARAVLGRGNDRYAQVAIGAEVGFQIPLGAPLVLAFQGEREVVKGIVGIEYL